MKIMHFRILMFFLLITLVMVSLVSAQAHGKPVIGVQPSIAPAGGQIMITGTEMEAGEIFSITLENTTNMIPLGEATETGEGEEVGFVALFIIPSDVKPGSFTVRAATVQGEAAIADLTVTEASTQASAAPASVREPSGESHLLNRNKPTGQIAGIGLIAFANLVLGVWLVRKPG